MNDVSELFTRNDRGSSFVRQLHKSRESITQCIEHEVKMIEMSKEVIYTLEDDLTEVEELLAVLSEPSDE